MYALAALHWPALGAAALPPGERLAPAALASPATALRAVTWLAAVLVLAAAGLPVARRVLPDRHAAGLAPAVGLGAATLLAYWLGHFAWGRGVAALAALLVVGAGGALVSRDGGLPPVPRGPVLAFSLAFCGLLAYRAVFPGVYPAGGEKFLDYGLLKSLLRADRLPPLDPWFAGHPVRYYYGGILGVADVAELAGVPARYAYNLGLATFYATLASAAYALAASVAEANDDRPAVGGTLGAVIVVAAGHLATPVRLLVARLPEHLALSAFGGVFAGVRAAPSAAYSHYHDLGTWAPWFGRYVVPGTLSATPAWAYENADLNAYMLATPFLVVAAAVAFALARADETRRRWGLLGALGATGGLLALVSTWSYPDAVGLAGLALALGETHPAGLLGRYASRARCADARLDELSRLALAVVGAFVVAAVGFAVAAPFLLFHTPVNGGVGFLPPRSPVESFLLATGVPLAAFGLRVAGLLDATRRRLAAVLLGLLAAVALASLVSLGATALLLAGLLAGWYLRRRRDAGFEAVLLVAGCGLLLAVEFAYAKVWPHDPNAPRWNTVYKVSMQVWVLWGVGCGAALAGVLTESIRAFRQHVPDSGTAARVTAVVLVLLAALAFPALAVTHRAHAAENGGPLRLDATHYADAQHPGEADAIRWLDAKSGQPTIIEAPGTPMYQFRSEAASLTGLPDVIGWHHEQGYRGPDAWRTRIRDVRSIYAANWTIAARLLAEYDVRYVYVGPNERKRYDVRSFDHPGVATAYRNPTVTVYRVNASAACAAVRADCPP